MRTYPFHEARAAFSKFVDHALAGEPQRVTRYGKEAVVIVSEDQRNKRSSGAPTLADLSLQHDGADGYGNLFGERPWKEDRPLGSDLINED